MQLMQLNWFLEHGLLDYDRAARQLSIHYERYHTVVAELLEEVMAIQQAGDKAAADRFVSRWTAWDERHAALAKALRDAEKSRFRLVRYAALGE
jgi:hemoglobin-like flavoprotein